MNRSKILIIDDDENITTLLSILLKDNNYDVSVSNDIINASRKIQKNCYDLILLDIMLSWMSGYDFYDLLKIIPETQDTPVIFISGKNSFDDIQKGMRYGAVDYITKPFQTNDIIDRIKKVC